MLFVIISFIVAYFFAINIGASGAAASMGIAYGAGAVNKKVALFICAAGILLGAVLGGGKVIETIGHNIIPVDLFTVDIVIIILASATLSLFLANLIGIPLSTSEVTVGAVVGVGIAMQALYIRSIITVVAFWIMIPVLAYLLAYFIGKILNRNKPFIASVLKRWKKAMIVLLVFSGFLEAVSAGMNNVANAFGPLVGGGLMSLNMATMTGGLFVAAGAFFFGGKVIETNGKKITNISIPQGISISSLAALLVIGASIIGIPMPLTQVTTSAIMGIGAADKGMAMWQKGVIAKIIKVWVVSPVFSLVISYGLMTVLIAKDYYTGIVLLGVIIATLGSISLAQTIKTEKRAVHEQGGGI